MRGRGKPLPLFDLKNITNKNGMHKEPERRIRSRIEGLLFRISTIPPQYRPHYEEELTKYQQKYQDITGKPYRRK